MRTLACAGRRDAVSCPGVSGTSAVHPRTSIGARILAPSVGTWVAVGRRGLTARSAVSARKAPPTCLHPRAREARSPPRCRPRDSNADLRGRPRSRSRCCPLAVSRAAARRSTRRTTRAGSRSGTPAARIGRRSSSSRSSATMNTRLRRARRSPPPWSAQTRRTTPSRSMNTPAPSDRRLHASRPLVFARRAYPLIRQKRLLHLSRGA